MSPLLEILRLRGKELAQVIQRLLEELGLEPPSSDLFSSPSRYLEWNEMNLGFGDRKALGRTASDSLWKKNFAGLGENSQVEAFLRFGISIRVA